MGERSWADTKGGDGKGPQIKDLVELYDHPANKWVRERFIGGVTAYCFHWMITRKKDGTKGKFPKQCLSFDAENEIHDSTKECPWCDAESKLIQTGVEYYSNSIIRNLQDQKPEKRPKWTTKEKESTENCQFGGFKEKDSDSWTPVRGVRVTRSLSRDLKRLQAANRHKSKKTGENKAWPLAHVFWGCDVKIMYNPDEQPAKKYSVQCNTDDPTPLTDEEKEYLIWKLDGLLKPDPLKKAKEDFDRWEEKMGKKKSDDEDEEDTKESKRSRDEDEDDVEDRPKKKRDEDEGEDFDEKPKKKKVEEDEEEDETPKKKKRESEDDELDIDKPKKKKSDDDDNDDDFTN